MNEFKKGDRVKCIDGTPNKFSKVYRIIPKYGAVLTIRGFTKIGLILIEELGESHDFGFGVHRFELIK